MQQQSRNALTQELGLACGLVMALLALEVPTAIAQETPRREVPDYDSRPPRGDDAIDGLLWVPRILTGPLYLLWEYGLRTPIGAGLTAIERSQGSGGGGGAAGPDIAVLPIFYYDYGFLPSFGLYARWNDFLATGNRLSVRGALWGFDVLSLGVEDRATVGNTRFFIRGVYLRRPDYVIGTHAALGQLPSGTVDAARYSSEAVDGDAGYRVEPGGRSFIGASVHGRWARFDPSGGLFNTATQSGVALPTGFDGYTALSLRVGGALDTRDGRGLPSGGVRLALHGEIARTLEGHAWIGYGGEALAATDFLGGRRTLSIAVEAAGVQPVGGSAIPFDQLVDVGGRGPLHGFWPGRLRGMTAAAATLGYEWPVWVFLNARVHVAVGNAFDQGMSGFAFERLRLSFGLAIEPVMISDHPFELGVAVGTDMFVEGATPSSFRFFIGTRSDV